MSEHGLSIPKTKELYNSILKKHDKAVLYMNNDEIPVEKRMRWTEGYYEIVKDLSEILDIIGVYSAEEALRGFECE
jgi:hypothetical protein